MSPKELWATSILSDTNYNFLTFPISAIFFSSSFFLLILDWLFKGNRKEKQGYLSKETDIKERKKQERKREREIVFTQKKKKKKK